MSRRGCFRAAFWMRGLVPCLLAIGWLAWGAAQEREFDGGFRFAHQAADAPLVDVLVDGRAVFRDVGFGTVTGYVPLAPRAHRISVVPHRLREADTSSDDAGEATARDRRLEKVTTFLTVAPGAYHTAVLTGFYEPPAEDRQLGQLSIDVTPEETGFRISGPRGYAEEFSGDQLLTDVQPGTYTIRADLEGYSGATYEAAVQPRSTTTVSIALQEGEDDEESDPQMVGSPEGSDTWATLQVQTFTDDFGTIPPAGSARIRIVHVSPTSPSLLVSVQAETDDSADGDRSSEPIELATLTYPAAGEFVVLPAGRYAIRLEASITRRALVELGDVDLAAGAVYTFFLTSEPSGARPRVVLTVDAAIVMDEAAP